ncbi:hypothetical protein A3G65_03880 [Candidatus Roizmanbacteria bacterium RIFCSPLOWO2_12_FULL_37_7b]|nr:MAG: hypothetical protein A3G65_03880 [Candidatus Roizmanbacteria bacterium RIFCSPLOWO2_12_FULL_37_7b]
MRYFQFMSNGLNKISKGIFMIAVFFTVLNLFSFFSEDQHMRVSPQDTLLENRKQMEAFVNSPDIDEPAEKLAIHFYKKTACSTIGELCENGLDPEINAAKSISGKLTSIVAAPYANPPASGVYFVYESLHHNGFIPQAYAAEGIGFASMQSLLPAWKQFRNVSYLILILVIIAIGFMIMFRMKLNPQTVMAMLLSIFSNLLNIDVGDLYGKYLKAGPDDIFNLVTGDATGSNIKVTNIFWDLPNALLGLFGPMINLPARLIGSLVLSYKMLPWVNNTLIPGIKDMVDLDIGGQAGIVVVEGNAEADGFIKGLIHTFALNPIVSIIFFSLGATLFIPLIIGFIIFITVIFLFFRIILMLFKSYIKIIVYIILAPLIILIEAIPGKASFTAWFKNLFVELLTFPLFIAIFFIGLTIMQSANSDTILKLPFFFGVDSQSFSIIIGMAFLFMIPDLVMMAKKLLVPQPIPMPDTGPGVFFGGITTAGGAGLSKLTQTATLGHYVAPVGQFLGNLPGPLGKLFAPPGKKEPSS